MVTTTTLLLPMYHARQTRIQFTRNCIWRAYVSNDATAESCTVCRCSCNSVWLYYTICSVIPWSCISPVKSPAFCKPYNIIMADLGLDLSKNSESWLSYFVVLLLKAGVPAAPHPKSADTYGKSVLIFNIRNKVINLPHFTPISRIKIAVSPAWPVEPLESTAVYFLPEQHFTCG